MDSKKLANAIRAEIKELEKRCESLKKMAVELEEENGGADKFGGNILSEKAIEKVVNKFKKEHHKPITADDLQRKIN